MCFFVLQILMSVQATLATTVECATTWPTVTHVTVLQVGKKADAIAVNVHLEY